MHPLLCIDMFSTSPKMHSLASKCALAETDTGTIGNTDTDRDTDTDTDTDTDANTHTNTDTGKTWGWYS